MESSLPEIPSKRYFTIGEVSELCGVKPYVLRYWEQEFTQLRPMKRRGNRRYYQHHEVLLIRRIRDLLYEQGFTISGARNQLVELGLSTGARAAVLLGSNGHRALPAEPQFTEPVSSSSSAELETEPVADDIGFSDTMPLAAEQPLAEPPIALIEAPPLPPLRTEFPLPLLHGAHAPEDVETLRRELLLIRDLLDWE